MQIYPEEKTRSQVIGIVLGSMALGVLLGYPFGGILYFLFNGKSALFFVISMLTLFVLGKNDLALIKGTKFKYFISLAASAHGPGMYNNK